MSFESFGFSLMNQKGLKASLTSSYDDSYEDVFCVCE